MTVDELYNFVKNTKNTSTSIEILGDFFYYANIYDFDELVECKVQFAIIFRYMSDGLVKLKLFHIKYNPELCFDEYIISKNQSISQIMPILEDKLTKEDYDAVKQYKLMKTL